MSIPFLFVIVIPKIALSISSKTSKTIKSTSGTFELETPRDRAGSFEPQIVKKNQTTISNEMTAPKIST